MTPMTRLDLIVPKFSNEHVAFTDANFLTFERFLVDLCRGFTRHGDVEGAWKNKEGRIYRDQSRLYSVAVPIDLADQVAATIGEVVRRAFSQEAAFIEQVRTRNVAF